MRIGLGARIALVAMLLTGVTGLATAMIASASTQRIVKEDVDDFLQDRADDIVQGRRDIDDDRGRGDDRNDDRDDVAGVDEEGVRRAVEADAIVQLLDTDGNPVASTGQTLPIGDADIDIADGDNEMFLRTETIDGEAFRVLTVSLDGGGAVQVATSIETTYALLGTIRGETLVVGSIFAGLAGVVGWVLVARATRPLRQLTATVEAIRDDGDIGRSVGIDRRDEVGRLADAFDGLMRSLEESRTQQRQLVEDAAHELRTPLTSVRANIDFLAHASDLDPDSRRSVLDGIKSEISELSGLVGEVVDLATEPPSQTTFEPVDLADVAYSVLDQFSIRSDRAVMTDVESSMVLGDRAQLERALANLVGNADKYTPDQAAPMKVSVAGGSVVVGDRGPGVAPEDRARVFERFWRADSARPVSGSGLGLAIVQKVVEAHGGTAFVRGRVGGGAEFGFELTPLADPSTADTGIRRNDDRTYATMPA